MTAVRSARNEPAGALALLASQRFGPLFASQFLSAFNDNALRNALVLMIERSQVQHQTLADIADGVIDRQICFGF